MAAVCTGAPSKVVPPPPERMDLSHHVLASLPLSILTSDRNVTLPLLDECPLCQIGTISADPQRRTVRSLAAGMQSGTHIHSLHGTLPQVGPFEPTPSCIIVPKSLVWPRINSCSLIKT